MPAAEIDREAHQWARDGQEHHQRCDERVVGKQNPPPQAGVPTGRPALKHPGGRGERQHDPRASRQQTGGLLDGWARAPRRRYAEDRGDVLGAKHQRRPDHEPSTGELEERPQAPQTDREPRLFLAEVPR